MTKVQLKHIRSETPGDWDNLRMSFEREGEIPQIIPMTRNEVIDLDTELFEIILTEQNTVNRDIRLGQYMFNLSPDEITEVCAHTSEFVHAWALHAFDNDWLETDESSLFN